MTDNRSVKEMRLNGLGASDEVTLVPLNKIEPAQTKPEIKPVENTTQETTHNTKNEYCFYCNKFGHFKAECQKMRRDKWQQTRRNNGQTKKVQAPRLNAILAANLIKRKIVGMEPTQPTIRDLSVTSNKKRRRIPPPNKRQLNSTMNQKTNYAAPVFWGNNRCEGVFNRGSPYHLRK